ncbi:unnamed protein product [Effrenium voratum]|uniref:Uncharacterized protein n=1 Tax=Effrenium voratum TaxID=2562239 RepID=A0AA36MXF5_9DINO|nr:unnamed protein product [Effrenium voratum]
MQRLLRLDRQCRPLLPRLDPGGDTFDLLGGHHAQRHPGACIDINELLDRDAEVLTEASAEALLLRRENAAEVAALLHSIERRIAMFDDKQQILGFTMTASFRNGWVASLVLAALSSLVELVRTMRKDVGYWIATGDQLIMNATVNAWSFWSHNETSQ